MVTALQLLPYLGSITIVLLCAVLGALVVDRVLSALSVRRSGIRAIGVGGGTFFGFVLGNTLTVLSSVLPQALS